MVSTFDEYLCPIRGKDRNYMMGPFGQAGWWTIWFPTDAEKTQQVSHLLYEWEDRIAACGEAEGTECCLRTLVDDQHVLPVSARRSA